MAPIKDKSVIWEAFTVLDSGKVKCKMCDKWEGSANSTRMAAHFTGQSRDTAACSSRDDLPEHIQKFLHEKHGLMQKKRSREDNAQTISQMFSSDSKKAADLAIASLAYGAGLPFALFKSVHWHRAVKAITAAGKAYAPPGYDRLRTSLLDDVQSQLKVVEEPVRAEYDNTGVTVCSDGWTDVMGCALLAALVALALQTMFLTVDRRPRAKSSDHRSHAAVR